jgi:hypothetical protein
MTISKEMLQKFKRLPDLCNFTLLQEFQLYKHCQMIKVKTQEDQISTPQQSTLTVQETVIQGECLRQLRSHRSKFKTTMSLQQASTILLQLS